MPQFPRFYANENPQEGADSRLTHRSSSSCGIVRPASTSAKPSRVRRSFSSSVNSGRSANSFSSGLMGWVSGAQVGVILVNTGKIWGSSRPAGKGCETS